MQRASESHGPCRGFRVLDFTTMVSGPVCTQYLADLGADVTKIEAPAGDPSRFTGSASRKGMTGFFAQLNRNKRSLVIDLRNAQGTRVVHRLAEGADVVVENFRPGVADRLDIGYDALRTVNPKLIYTAISGFGTTGPYAGHPAYDHILQGLTGMMPAQGGEGPPRMLQSVAVDKASGMAAGSATLAALLARERNGGDGQRVDVPMLDAYAAFMLPEAVGSNAFPELPPPNSPSAQIFRTWETKDGYIVGIVVQDSQYKALCEMIEREDLADDERFATLVARFQNVDALYEVIESEFLKRPSDVLVERARRFGAPFGPVHDFEGFINDPQTQHNGTVFEVEDSDGARTRYLTHPARFEKTPAVFTRPAPMLGEHSDTVLAEAGFDDAEVDALRASGAFG